MTGRRGNSSSERLREQLFSMFREQPFSTLREQPLSRLSLDGKRSALSIFLLNLDTGT